MKPTTHSVEGYDSFPHPVEVPLKDEELLAYADEIAALDTKQKEADSVLDEAKGHHKQETAGINARKETILHLLRTKRDTKDLACYNTFDYENGVCTIRRLDNHEKVSTRKMTEKEFRGRPLFPKEEMEKLTVKEEETAPETVEAAS